MIFDGTKIINDKNIIKDLDELKLNIVDKVLSGEINSINYLNRLYINNDPTFNPEELTNKILINSKNYVSKKSLDKAKIDFIKCFPQFDMSKTAKHQTPDPTYDLKYIDSGNCSENGYDLPKYDIELDTPRWVESEFDAKILPSCHAWNEKGAAPYTKTIFWHENLLHRNLKPLQLAKIQAERTRTFGKLKNSLKAHFSHVKHHQVDQSYFWYKPNNVMGWHSNCNNAGMRVYFVWCDEDNKSFFRWQDPTTGKIHTKWEKKGWNINWFSLVGHCIDYGVNNLFWHCVHSECNRISFSYKVWY
tara:strand:+ start:1028 stop:1936 length:909 start_codon:yes stop_codon:yes gene_type:complete